LIRTVLPNGTVETRSYDVLNRLTFLEDTNSSGGVIASYTYILGPTGLRDAVVENTGRRDDYTYDALDRLTEEKIIDAVFGNRSIDYTYDAAGNRLTMTDSVAGTTSYTYDAMDRLTTETLAGQVTQYTYDKNGNMLSRVSPTDAAFYHWDFDNRLIAAGTNGNGTIDETNVYDADGNLVSQTMNGQETRYLIDTAQAYPQVALEYRPSGLIVASYVYGNSLISQSRGGVTSYYEVDGLGSTRELTNTTGAVTDSYVYDAFGRILGQTGTTVNPYLFTGQRQDAVTGLDYLRARFLDPTTGRFVSADSFPGFLRSPLSLNHYVYTDQDPVNFTDPTGHFSLAELGIADVIQGILDAVDSVGSSKAFYDTVKGLADALFIGAVGLGILAGLSEHGFKNGFEIHFENAAGEAATVQEVGFGVFAENEPFKEQGYKELASLVVKISVKLKGLGDKEVEIPLSHPKKLKFGGGDFKVKLFEVPKIGFNILTLYVAASVSVLHPSVELSFKAEVGPLGLLKFKVPFLKIPDDFTSGGG
jgi:RHS repeat-associated protein